MQIGGRIFYYHSAYAIPRLTFECNHVILIDLVNDIDSHCINDKLPLIQCFLNGIKPIIVKS